MAESANLSILRILDYHRQKMIKMMDSDQFLSTESEFYSQFLDTIIEFKTKAESETKLKHL